MAKPYFKLHFDEQGYPLNRNERDTILRELLQSSPAVTDLWIFSHGWNNDEARADDTYDKWVARLQEQIQVENLGAEYIPLCVGIYWPSKAWSSSVEETGSDFTPDSVSPATSTAPSEEEFHIPAGEFETDFEPSVPEGAASSSDDLESTFELGGSDSTLNARQQFIEEYRAIFDPAGLQETRSEQDIGRLYDLIFQTPAPTPAQVNEFLAILARYCTDDPQPEQQEAANFLDNYSEIAVELSKSIASNEGYLEGFNPVSSLLDFFRISTFWTMKGRSAIVGENGVAAFLRDLQRILRQQNRKVRLHLFGHSFGAKLVTAAIYGQAAFPDLQPPYVDSLILLLGAFSQFSFTHDIPGTGGSAGRYTGVIDQKFVANPVLAIFSRYDKACGQMYPLGMRFADPAEQYEAVSSDNLRGAIGANGIQGLDPNQSRLIEMLPLDAAYQWGQYSGLSCLNVDAYRYINQDRDKFPSGSHGDTNHPEIFHLALSLSRRLAQEKPAPVPDS